MDKEWYLTEGEKILNKIDSGEELTVEDMENLRLILCDPLQEFCRREASFRLTEFHGLKNKDLTEDLLEETAETIRDVIDESEFLYDSIDSAIRNMMEELE